MHLSKVNIALNNKIVGGSEYQWQCWENARFLDYESDYAYANVVFNTKTQEVYVAEVNDKQDKHTPYRWLNPSYKDQYISECQSRNIDSNIAWDYVKWYDLELSEDWLEKASSIMEGKIFDKRVKIPLDIDDDTLLKVFKMAHERDITFNKMVEIILQELIDKHRQNQFTS